MNPQISPSANPHAQIVLLLPWYVNQSLTASERQQVDHHVRSCLICRRELLELRKLASAVQQAADLDVAAEASFAGLRAKMQTASLPRQAQIASSNSQNVALLKKANNAKPSGFGNRFRHFTSITGKYLAIAACLLLVTLPAAMQYLPSSNTNDYHTLSAAKPETHPTSQLRVVFSKNLGDRDVDAVLSQFGAIRVGGPNSMGAYTLKLAGNNQSTDLTGVLTLLRSRQDVILAEPVLQP